jgi:hypothetical protein
MVPSPEKGPQGITSRRIPALGTYFRLDLPPPLLGVRGAIAGGARFG